MNEILQQRIEEAAAAIAPFNRMSQKRDCFVKGATFALQNQWISVEDELPPYDKDVFVRYEMLYPKLPPDVGYCVRWRTMDETVRKDKNQFSILGDMEITHWMPIPSLKGGEE